jgi:hypothetical protein
MVKLKANPVFESPVGWLGTVDFEETLAAENSAFGEDRQLGNLNLEKR